MHLPLLTSLEPCFISQIKFLQQHEIELCDRFRGLYYQAFVILQHTRRQFDHTTTTAGASTSLFLPRVTTASLQRMHSG